MAHFAEIDENNVVKRVIVADYDFIESGVMGPVSNWIRTSYNSLFREKFAGIGDIYDPVEDVFKASEQELNEYDPEQEGN